MSMMFPGGGGGGSRGSAPAEEEDDLERGRRRIDRSLADCVKEIQVEHHLDPQQRQQHPTIETNEVSAGLVTAVEAMLVHGLKDSFADTRRKTFARRILFAAGGAAAANDLPQPSFWTFVMVFSHRETLKKIDSLPQLATDVGRSRAWVRMALNDGLSSSYLSAMAADQASCRRHYRRGAFVRDPEALDVAARYLAGIQVYRFDLALNSGLLNRWQSAPLVLAGVARVCAQPQVDQAVATAIDVASTLDEDQVEDARSRLDKMEKEGSGHIQYIKDGLLNEDEALRMILRGSGSGLSSSLPKSGGDDRESGLVFSDMEKPSPPKAVEVQSGGPPSSSSSTKEEEEAARASSSLSPSSDDAQEAKALEEEEEENMESIYSSNFVSRSFEEKSQVDIFTALRFKAAEGVHVAPSATVVDETDDRLNGGTKEIEDSTSTKPLPCLSGFVHSWNPFGPERHFDTPPQTAHDDVVGFAVGNNGEVHVPGLSLADTRRFVACFDNFPPDLGLGAQNFECFDCARAIGTVFGPWKQCAFTKKYFCPDCHVDDAFTIPARIVFNWDFSKMKVSRKSATFLRAMSDQPIELPEDATSEFPHLKEATRLRKKLKFMNAYLSTCASRSQPRAKSVFARVLEPHVHLYEEERTFSVADLEQVNDGRLLSKMNEAASFARGHIVKECLLCSGRGFICEMCRRGSPIYPFDLDLVKQCQRCFAVFHLQCARGIDSCPKCDRLEARNLNWHVSASRSKKVDNGCGDDEG